VCVQKDTLSVPYGSGVDSVANFINTTYEYDYNFRWPAIAIEIAFIVFLRLIVAVATKYLRFQKR
jgi:ABC-type multidrug transport system permease subunit